MGVYGAASVVADAMSGWGTRRGFGILAITAAAAASTLCTFLIPPARDTWYTLIHSLLNPMTRSTIVDWKPLIPSLMAAPGGSVDEKYFIVVLLFFAAAIVSVIVTPRGEDTPMDAVATVLLVAAFAAVRNVPIAAIALAPVLANHLGRLSRGRAIAPPATTGGQTRPAARLVMEIIIVVVAIGFASYSGILKPGIDASDNPAGCG
jgi:hypothetical protein